MKVMEASFSNKLLTFNRMINIGYLNNNNN